MPTTEEDRLFLVSYSSTSRREAHVAEEVDSIWLYLTLPSTKVVDTVVWLLNTPDAPRSPSQEPYRSQHAPPPLPARLAKRGGVRIVPGGKAWRFLWSSDGDAVAALLKDVPVGFVIAGIKRGFSRYAKPGGAAWGLPWDAQLFKARFQWTAARGMRSSCRTRR